MPATAADPCSFPLPVDSEAVVCPLFLDKEGECALMDERLIRLPSWHLVGSCFAVLFSMVEG